MVALEGSGADLAGALRRDIVAGTYAQGQRLPEDALAVRYGVSRVPIREALRALQGEGFVEVERYRGARVAMLSGEDAMDLMRLRQTLEAVAARRAAARRPWRAVEHLARLLAQGANAIDEGDVGGLAELNSQLHRVLVEASGSTNLVALHRQLGTKIRWVYSVGLDERAPSSWSEHEDIVAAVAAGDGERSGILAHRHVEAAMDHYQHQLDKTTAHPPEQLGWGPSRGPVGAATMHE